VIKDSPVYATNWWYKRRDGVDHGDWMLHPEAFQCLVELWKKTSVYPRKKRFPLSVDGAADISGSNAYFKKHYSKNRDFMLAQCEELAGRGLYCNPDYRKVKQYLDKIDDLWGQGCDMDVCLVLPAEPHRPWYPRLKEKFTPIHTFSRTWRGSDNNFLFSRPLPGSRGLRESPGQPPFEVTVWVNKQSLSPQSYTVSSSTGQSWTEPAKYKPHLNVVPVVVNGRVLSCLLDDGAQCSLITPKAVQILGLQTSPTQASLGWFDSSRVPITESVAQLNFTIHGNSLSTADVLVAPLTNWDMVLGLPFRLHTNMQVNYSVSDRRFVCDDVRGRRVGFSTSRHYVKPIGQRTELQAMHVDRCDMKEALRLCSMGAEMFYVWPNRKLDPDPDLDPTHVTAAEVRMTPYSPEELRTLLETSLGPQLTVDQRTTALHRLMQYSDVFQPLITPPTPHPDTDLKIELHPDSHPKQAPPFSFTEEEQRWLAQFLDELSLRNWVEDSTSEWASPALLVRKPKGGYRLVIDYRHLNAQTKQDKYPIPRISDILLQSTGSSWFSTLDLQHGFHQTYLHPQYRHLTTFSTPFGLYQWTVCPQGVTNGPSSFSRRIRSALRDIMAQPQKYCAAYIDDILIHSKSFEQHLDHMCSVLAALQADHLHASLSKSVLFRTGVTYLGHFLSENGVSPDPSKLEALKSYPEPTSLATLWKFVGAVNWFRTFIPHLSTYIHPLQLCIRNSSKDHFAWDESSAAAFAKVKDVLCELTEQAVFDPNHQTCLWTDASDVGLGAVLLQCNPTTKQWSPVHFFSRSLQDTESRYDVRDKELLSVIASLKSMHHLLRGVPFQLLTDHRSLQHLRSTKLHTSARHIRWLDYMQQFQFEPIYIPGESNCMADLLSRRPTWFKHFEGSLKKWADRWSDQGLQTNAVFKFIHVSAHAPLNSSDDLSTSPSPSKSQLPLPTELPNDSVSTDPIISSLSSLPLPVTHLCVPVPVGPSVVADLLPADLLHLLLQSQQRHLDPAITLSILRVTAAGQLIVPPQDEQLAHRLVAELHSSFHHLGKTKTAARVLG